jgi:hypothetical protein
MTETGRPSAHTATSGSAAAVALGSKGAPEVVDWAGKGPNEIITLNALRVFQMAKTPR